MTIQANERLRQIADFVYNHLKEAADSKEGFQNYLEYRWEHTLRVANYGKQIAAVEGADVELVVAGCLLHDVGKFDTDNNKEHGRISAKVSRPLLIEIGYSSEQVDNICYSVAAHVDGEAGYEHAKTLEADCVSDADNIDRFGALRILQWCKPQMENYPAFVEALEEALPRYIRFRERDVLETATGKALFREQLDRQITFYKDLLKESELTKLPQL